MWTTIVKWTTRKALFDFSMCLVHFKLPRSGQLQPLCSHSARPRMIVAVQKKPLRAGRQKAMPPRTGKGMVPHVYRGYYGIVSQTQIAQAKLLWPLKATVGREEPNYESISQIGTPLYNGQKACSQCVHCLEAPLYTHILLSSPSFPITSLIFCRFSSLSLVCAMS